MSEWHSDPDFFIKPGAKISFKRRFDGSRSHGVDEFFLILASIQKKRLTYNDFFDPGLYPLHESIENSSLRTLSSDLALKNGLELAPLEQILIKY
jgi:hypothetical protein